MTTDEAPASANSSPQPTNEREIERERETLGGGGVCLFRRSTLDGSLHFVGGRTAGPAAPKR